LEIRKTADLSLIESGKYARMIGALGKETLVHIAKSENETKAKLLGGLGLKSMIISDSKNPVNLMSLADGNTYFLNI
jgi:major vault protein